MILKQKVATAVTAITFLIAAGVIETNPIISALMLCIMLFAVMLGGLDKKESPVNADRAKNK